MASLTNTHVLIKMARSKFEALALERLLINILYLPVDAIYIKTFGPWGPRICFFYREISTLLLTKKISIFIQPCQYGWMNNHLILFQLCPNIIRLRVTQRPKPLSATFLMSVRLTNENKYFKII